MDPKALSLTCRFSFSPNQLGYCGQDSAGKKFKDCIIRGITSGIQKEISHFIVLNPYLSTISTITKLPKFSYQVIESYWLGNNLLKKFHPKHYSLILKNFKKQGVPQWLIDELDHQKPSEFIPTHLFQVLHVGVGRASGSVPFNLNTINNCMIRWGEVIGIDQDQIEVNLTSLKRHLSKYQLIKIKTVTKIDKQLVPNLNINDIVAVHWGWVVKKLTKPEIANLSYWTDKVLATITIPSQLQS